MCFHLSTYNPTFDQMEEKCFVFHHKINVVLNSLAFTKYLSPFIPRYFSVKKKSFDFLKKVMQCLIGLAFE